MISFLEGKLVAKSLNNVLINVGGVGFEVNMSSISISQLSEVGASVQVLTYLQVRDDAFVLYGFGSTSEKEAFEKLIGVSGVGPKVALSVLSFYTPEQLAAAIAAQDVDKVSKIPGIGKKTASRIILELKGSFDGDMSGLLEDSTPAQTSVADGVTEALLSMGFTTREISLALQDAPTDATEAHLLQYALKKLG